MHIFEKLLCCPACKADLQKNPDSFLCLECSKTYPIVSGVPIFLLDMQGEQLSTQKELFNDTYAGINEYKLELWQKSFFKRTLEGFNLQGKRSQKKGLYIDIGSGGNGYQVIEMAKLGIPAIGIDISITGILQAKKFARSQGVENKTYFIVADANNLPFKSGVFEYLSCIMVLEHLETDDVCVSEIGRVLSDTGSVYISVPNTYLRMWPFLWPLYLWWDKKLGHMRHYSEHSLTELFSYAGGLQPARVFYTVHLVKFVQLALSFYSQNTKVWWWLESIDWKLRNFKNGLNLNAVFVKEKHVVSEASQKTASKSGQSVFDEEYFTQYYQAMTGDFSPAFLRKNINWFFGWFTALYPLYNFREGKNKKVLEIGCAIGAASRILAERGFVVTATDVSQYAVKKAALVNQHPNLSFEKMDILSTQKYEDTFDVIFGFEVIEHLDDPVSALKNMHRMLKKDGVLILSTPYPYTYVFRDVTHVSVKHPIDWQRILVRCGYANVRYTHTSFVPFLYRLSRYFHITFPGGLPTPFINSTIFLYAQK